MPWFITSIATKENGRCPDTRTFGFYTFYQEAFEAVRENRGNMHECLYNYLVLEYIEPGIHPHVHLEEWYEWNTEQRHWTILLAKPTEFAGTINWALG